MNLNALRWSDQASGIPYNSSLTVNERGCQPRHGLDNLGRNIGESQEPTDLRVTQAEAASNLYRVGYIALVAMRASKTVLVRSTRRDPNLLLDGTRISFAREAPQAGRP
jgi:hypothetical protein